MLFYRTRSGSIGVSIDDGATVFARTGRRLPLDENVWEEAEDGSLDELPADTRAIVEDALEDVRRIATEDAAAFREAEAVAEVARAKAEAAAEKRRAEAAARAEARRAYWASPEGRAERERRNAAFRAFLGELNRIAERPDALVREETEDGTKKSRGSILALSLLDEILG